MTNSEVIASITSEATTDDLERIIDAVKMRRKILETILAANLKRGDRIIITNASPKYVNGATGTVESVRGAKATVLIDESRRAGLGRFLSARGTITAPVGMLTVIDEAA